jgi:hypothetical protein
VIPCRRAANGARINVDLRYDSLIRHGLGCLASAGCDKPKIGRHCYNLATLDARIIAPWFVRLQGTPVAFAGFSFKPSHQVVSSKRP